jgi:acyl-CoA reductase-like NAD-dependent aldehyde dehydrogenase
MSVPWAGRAGPAGAQARPGGRLAGRGGEAELRAAGHQAGQGADGQGAAGHGAADGVAATYRARQMLARAHWAAGAFATYDRAAVLRIAAAAATAAHADARRYAEWAVKETGFGVAEHKVMKNEACSLGVFERYSGEDYVSPRLDTAGKIVSLPRPAGVVLALTPSTNPVCSVFFKIIIALLTRNAIVVSPHPMAKDCCTDAALLLASAATQAGAPDGTIQVVRDATVPLIEALMSDPVTDVILATGGSAVVRAAHRSGNPALGVGPGNVPVLVDATADLAAAARRIVESKAFDNSVLCTNESVLVVEESAADQLLRELRRQHAALLDPAATGKLRAYLYPDGRLNAEAIGKDATWIADRAGVRVPPRTRVLLAPFGQVVGEEPFAHEKLSPVLGLVRAETAERGIEAARAVVRLGGAGHSAAIHSRDPATIMRYGSRVPVLRISVNVGNSTGSAGLETHLAPSMTLGTGFVGRSSIGENLEPRHLVNWARVAYNADVSVPFDDFTGIAAATSPDGPVPGYPYASNLSGAPGHAPASAAATAATGAPPNLVGSPDPAGSSGAGGWPGAEPSGGSPDAGSLAGAGGLPGAGSLAGADPSPDASVPVRPVDRPTVSPEVRQQLRALIIEELRQLVRG